jgi:hypothetical protein
MSGAWVAQAVAGGIAAYHILEAGRCWTLSTRVHSDGDRRRSCALAAMSLHFAVARCCAVCSQDS